MSRWTTELRFIAESLADNRMTGLSGVEAVIQAARPKIFSFQYPFWEESGRAEFETNFIRHFYTREIGYETYGLWKLKLQDWLIVNMPYYIRLYETTNFEYDPLTDYNEKREVDRSLDRDESNSTSRDDKGHSDTAHTTSGNGLLKQLDTPQNILSDLTSGKYLTNASQTENSGSGSDNTNSTLFSTITGKSDVLDTEKVIEKITGKRGGKSYAQMVEEYRQTILNIQKMVFDQMEFDLFIGLWDINN